MKKNALQYTIRNIPQSVDRALKQKAKVLNKSFNQTALEALILGSGESTESLNTKRRDLSEIINSMTYEEAEEQENEIRLQHQIDSEIWK